MTQPLSVCDSEIEYLCGYINDNGYIANYFGIPREVVVNVRERIKPRQRHHSRSLDASIAPTSDSAAMVRSESEIGCDRLLRAIQAVFRSFEAEHGLQHGAGEILLPAGWGGWK